MNIIKTLEKNIENGNSIIDKKGNIVSFEKLQKSVSKDYTKLIQKGEIDPMNLPFSEFFYAAIEDYLVVEELIAFIKGEEDETK